jgi:hypothetical protein
MFVRVKRSVAEGRSYEYLQLVRSYREGKRVRQEVLLSLGRKDDLLASGALDDLVLSLARHSERLRVVEVAKSLAARSSKSWGPALVFGRLWETQGLPEILGSLASKRMFEFDLERVAFAMALQRLCCPGSDLQGFGWAPTVEAPGLDAIQLQHFYRTAGFLASVREELETRLFFKDRDLFDRTLDLVFIDTTSTYVYRDTETPMRKRGYSRDRMAECPQLVLCVAVDAQGWPIAWQILPGNTADHEGLRRMVAALRERFQIRRAVVVADRGMISRDGISLLEDHATAPFDYVLGCRMRRQKEVNEEVLGRAGRYETVDETLAVKEVRVGDHRYVICLNRREAEKDAFAREAILEKLRTTLSRNGPKAVVGNKGFSRFLKVAKGSVTIDEKAVERDARLDGKYVLRTNTDLPAAEVATTYKSLWRVERCFRTTKSTLEVRPIFHHHDDTSIGHIVGCFLALRLEVDLQRRLDKAEVEVSWPDLMRDLGQVQAVTVDLDGKRYRLRTDLRGAAGKAFIAAGVRPPSAVEPLGPTPPEAAVKSDEEV